MPANASRPGVDATQLARAALPVLAVAVPVLSVSAILVAAGNTLGYDYLMYDAAARRLMSGGPLYDLAFSAPGPNGLFDYPPPFILAVLPFAASLPSEVAALAWVAMLNLCFAVGVALLPVSRTTRWVVLLLAGLSWPYLYAVKLGQLGPILFLLYALAWRWADRPWAVGVAAAAGTAAKLQPILLFGWALATRRFRAVAAGLGILLAAGVAAILLAGPASPLDWLTLISRVGGHALTAPGVLSVGAIAYRAGASEALASVLQWISAGVVGLVAMLAWVRYPAQIAVPVTAIASILVSPIVWPHYAVLVLLPVALLLERGQWWAAALPLAAWLPVDAVYPVIFTTAMLAPLVIAQRTNAKAGAPSAGLRKPLDRSRGGYAPISPAAGSVGIPRGQAAQRGRGVPARHR